MKIVTKWTKKQGIMILRKEFMQAVYHNEETGVGRLYFTLERRQVDEKS